MNTRILVVLLLPVSIYAQTAITELTSFWEMNVSAVDRIAWDSHGGKHGMYIGSGMEVPATIFGGGIKTVGDGGGMAIPGASVATIGSFTFAAWVRPSGASILLAKYSSTVSLRSFGLKMSGSRLQVEYYMTDGTSTTFTMPGGSPTITDGSLGLIWFAFDSGSGELKLAVNNSSWSNTTPAVPFRNVDRPLDFANASHVFAQGATTGRTMFWDGYIPSDAERAAIYNGGIGVTYSYFNAAGFDTPERPISVSLQSATFAQDIDLAENTQGLYWLRPFPLKHWSTSLAAANGDYIWVRSTDHDVAGGNPDGIYIGYSSSPGVLPSSWVKILDAAALSASDPTFTWTQLETPHLEYNVESGEIHLYAHAFISGSSNPVIQTTHVWTTTNLTTWTWEGVALPNTENYHHTGYATIYRRGAGDWVAQSLLSSGESGAPLPVTFGFWTSADGLSWTIDETTINQNVAFDYYQAPRWSRSGSGLLLRDYAANPTATYLEAAFPFWRLFEHDGFLQDTRAYVENGVVYLYAKWSYREPSTIRLYSGALSTSGHLSHRDRRPLASLFVGDATKTSTNPRGYQTVIGSPDFVGAGFATAKASLLEKVGNQLDNADLFSPRPQAVCVWDLEGQEFQHSFTYVGSPDKLAVLSPEMDLMADDLMALIRSRGYEPCITLRPQTILSGSGRPINGCMSQNGSGRQVYIDTAASASPPSSRGYTCGPGTVANITGEVFTTTGELVVNYQSGSVIRFYTSGTPPTPLVNFTDYVMCDWNNGAQTFKVSTVAENCASFLSPTGGSGTLTFMGWRGPADLAHQGYAADASASYDVTKAKVEYALGRWGMRYFYIDTTVHCPDAACQSSATVMSNDIWRDLRSDFPATLFIPENSSGGPYTGKYLSFNNAEYKRSVAILATYPDYFVIPKIEVTNPGYLDWRTEIQAEIKAGVPYMVNISAAPTGGQPTQYYNEDLAAMRSEVSRLPITDLDTGRSWMVRDPVLVDNRLESCQSGFIRMYFADDAAGLPASSTYCDSKDGACSLALGTKDAYWVQMRNYVGEVCAQGAVRTLPQ